MDRAKITVGLAMDMPIMHYSDRYDFVRVICPGNYGVIRLMRDKHTRDLVAVKHIERGDKKLKSSKIISLGGTPAYIAPEMLSSQEYDGKIADVWSCGVTLYVMLVGTYPFEDPDEPKDFRKTIQRILSVQYAIPDSVQISPECCHLMSRIFEADPETNLPSDLIDENTMGDQFDELDQPMQRLDTVMQIIAEATIPAVGSHGFTYMT